MALIPVERTSLVQSVIDQIVGLVRDGTLSPGDRLPTERDLMERLSVGRSTIREAVASLARMGLVEPFPGRGSTVKAPSVQSVIRPELLSVLLNRSVTVDLLEVRELIEPAAAELSAHRATEEDLTELQASLDRCQVAYVAGEHTAVLSAEVHLALARCAHNGVLVMFTESILGLLTERGDTLERIPGFTEWEMASHQRLIDAVRSGDGLRARHLMALHLEESTQRLLSDSASLPIDSEPMESGDRSID